MTGHRHLEACGGANAMVADGESKPVPVTVVSGLDGSGKTSLLRHIVKTRQSGIQLGIVTPKAAALRDGVAEMELNGCSFEGYVGDYLPVRMQPSQHGTKWPATCSLSQRVSASEVRISWLLQALRRLVDEKPIDHIVVDVGGLTHPRKAAEALAYDNSTVCAVMCYRAASGLMYVCEKDDCALIKSFVAL